MSGLTTVTITSPESDKVVHYFNAQGQETATEWQTASSVVLKKVENTWAQDYVASNGQAANGRVTVSKTYLNGTLSSTKELAYDTTNMNLVQEKLTEGAGAAGQVKTQKDITYTTLTGNYTVPTQETFKAIDPATGNFVDQGKTVYVYDEYSLTARSSVPNHTGNTSATNRGNLTTTKRYKDASNFVTESMKYDSVGNVVEKIDALNHSTLIDFTDNFTDTSKNGSKFAYPKIITNALNQYTTSKYDFNTGLVKETSNLRGYTTTTAYDLLNRVTTITEPSQTICSPAKSKVTTYSYDDTNRVTTKEVTVDCADNKGQVKTYFDKLYRVTKTRTNDPEGAIIVETEYDGKSRKKKVSNPYRESSETPVWTTTSYDATDRPLQIQVPDGSLVKYEYNFNQTTVTDEAGNQRRYTYNPLGQMTKVEEPNPTLVYHTPLVTTYKYYGSGPLYQADQSNQTRTFTYNWLGWMTQQALPESGTTTFTYNAAGLPTSKTDARNITITFSYDNTNRPTGKTYSDSTPSVSWGYDASGYTGLKTSMSDSVGSITYAYDNVDRLTQESRTLTGVGTFSTSYGYNIKGDLTSLTYPSGRVVNFNYNTGGGCCNSRLLSVVDQTTSTTLANGMTFNAAGATLTQTLNPGSNAIGETFQYNSRSQLTQIAASINYISVMNFSYDYGSSSTNTGRVLSRTDAIQPEHSQTYTYDSIYRLSNVISGDKTWSVGWTFDTWGNRLTQSPQGLAAGKVGSQILAYSTTGGVTNNREAATNLTYDAAGNITHEAGAGHAYAFNAENQITQMDGGAATYAYDGEGRRMKKTYNNETTYTFYGPGGILCEFSTVAGTSTATAASANDRVTYRTSDKLGSAALLIAGSGNILENNRTLPYGESWLADVISANDKKFTTYDRDAESALDYAMNRYYGNVGGRFVSADPKGSSANLRHPQTLNRYIYIANDPINDTDPDGLEPKSNPNDFCVIDGMVWPRSMCDLVFGFRLKQKETAWEKAVTRLLVAAETFLNRTSFSQDCLSDIAIMNNFAPGSLAQPIDIAALQNAISGASFKNGVGSGDSAAVLFPKSPLAQRAVAGKTVGSYFKENPNGLTAKSALEGNLIYVNPGLIGGNLAQNEGLLMHEALHLLGIDDAVIGKALNSIDSNIQPDANGNWTDTQQFSRKLAKDCFTGKDNQK